MTDPDELARRRYFTLAAVRIGGAMGAVLGIVLLGRAQSLSPKLIGGALVLSALIMMATVPRALARQWRTPPEP